MAGEDPEERRAQTVDVGGRADAGRVEALFGGHEIDTADKHRVSA